MLSHHSARITIGKCGWPVSGLRLTGSNPNPAGAPYVQRAERVRDRAKKSSEVRAEQGWEQGWVPTRLGGMLRRLPGREANKAHACKQCMVTDGGVELSVVAWGIETFGTRQN